MSDAIVFDGVRYIATAEAGERAALSSDYIASLARHGHIRGKQAGRHWYIDPSSLDEFLAAQTASKAKRSAELSADLRRVAQQTGARVGAAYPAHAKTPASLIPPEVTGQREPSHAFQKVVAASLALALTFGAATAVSSSVRASIADTIDRIAAMETGLANLAAAGEPVTSENGNANSSPATSAQITATSTENESQTSPGKPTETATSYTTQNSSIAHGATSAPQSNQYPEATSLLATAAPAFDASDFVTQNELDAQLLQITNALDAKFTAPATSSIPQNVAADGNNFSPYVPIVPPINNLSGVTITNANLTASEIPALDYFPATNTVSVSYGGTGNSTAPGYGQLLLGDGSGGYTLAATSSLGIVSGGTPGGADAEVQFNSGGTFDGSSSFTFASSTDLLTVANASTTDLTAGNATTTNATSTNLFASLANFTTGIIGNLSGSSLTYSAASTTNFSNVGTASFGATATTTIDSAGDLTVAGNTTLQNATTTSLFATSAVTASAASFGATATSSFNSAGQLTLAGLASTVLAVNSSGEVIATSTLGSNVLSVPSNSLLAGNASGALIATSSIGTNLLTGALGTINGTPLSAGGSIAVTAASSTLLEDNNTFSGNSSFTQTITGSVSGNANTATTLQTARTINGVSFNGTANIVVTAASSTLLADNNIFSGADSFTDASSNFAGAWQGLSPSHFQTAGTYLTGIGNYATTTGTAISISTSTLSWDGLTLGNTFAVSGSGITVTPTVAGTISNAGLTNSTVKVNGTTLTLGDTNDTIAAASSTLLGDNNTFSGADSFNDTITGSISGNAGTATKLQTARTINGVSFDGSANIAITAASSTLLANNNTWTGLQQSANASTSLETDSALWLPNIGINSLAYVNGANQVAAASAAYPLQFSGGSLSLAFGTTTANTWSQLQTLQSGFLSQASSTVVGSLTLTGTLQAQGSASIGTTLAVNGTSGTTTIASGQGFTVGGSQFVMQQGSGHVGIGTANPSYKLDVSGNARITGGLVIPNSASVIFQNISGGNDGQIDEFGSNNIVFTSGLSNTFEFQTAANGTPDVAIGNIIPGYPLDVNGTINSRSTVYSQSTMDAGLSSTDAVEIGGGATYGYIKAWATSGGSYANLVIPGGNVGIGTTSPFTTLGIAGNTYLGGTLTTTGTTQAAAIEQAQGNYIYPGRTDSGGNYQTSWFLGSNGTYGLYTNTGLYLAGGLWANQPSYFFAPNTGAGQSSAGGPILAVTDGFNRSVMVVRGGVDGTAFPTDAALNVGGGNGITYSIDANHAINAANGYYQNSDERLKQNVESLGASSSLAEIEEIDPISFNWKDVGQSTSTQFGVLAQQLQTVFPNLVLTGGTTTITLADGTQQQILDTLSVDYSGLIAPLIASVQQINGVFNATDASTSAPSVWSTFEGTTTPVTIDPWGNVGIGTSTATSTTDLSLCLNGSCVTSFAYSYSATSSTSSTPTMTLSQNFLSAIENALTQWLNNAQNGIGQFFAQVGNFQTLDSQTSNASTTNTQTLNASTVCLTQTSGQQVCVTGDQLAALLSAAGASQPTESETSPTSNIADSSIQNLTPEIPESVASATSSSDASATPPVVQVNGDNPAIIQVGDTYNDLGATITDPQADLNLGIQTYVNGAPMSPVEIDTSEAATDTIDYVATDQTGLTSTSTRTVIVEAPSIVPSDATSTTAATTATTTDATATAQ